MKLAAISYCYQISAYSRKVPARLLCLLPLSLGLASYSHAQQAEQKIEELVVNATRLPRTIEDIAGTVSLISAEVMEREMVDDLDDVIRFQPGVTINTASRGGNQGFSIRGIGGNRVLTVVDGIRSSDIYKAGPASYGKDSFEMDNLKSVQIIRGPASVLYGADAMGGAVILTSKDPRDYVRANEGSYFNIRTSAADADEQYKGGVTAAFQRGDYGLVTQFTHRAFEEQNVNGPGKLNPQDGESDGLLLKGYWDISEEQRLIVSLDSFQEENDVILESEIGRSVTSSFGHDETDRTRVGLEYQLESELPLFDSLQLAFNWQETDALQHTVQDRNSYSFLNPMDPTTYGGTPAVRETDFEFNQETTAVNLNLSKTITSGELTHSLAYGFNYDETDTERPRNRCETQVPTGQVTCSISAYPFASPEVFPNKTFPDTTTTRTGIYLQDEIAIADSKLTLIPGVRYDRYEMDADPDSLLDGTGDIKNYGGFSVSSINEDAISLSLGALYDIDDVYSLFAQYTEGYRPPNFDEANQAFVNLGFGYATIPNPELTAESSKGLELGIRANYERAFVSLAAYQNRYEDFIESSFIGTEGSIRLFQDRNLGDVAIRGAEFTSSFYLNDEWQLRASLAYAHGDNEEAGTPLDSVDPLTGVVGIRYDSASDRWGGEILLTAVDKKDRVSSDTAVTDDSYSVVDLVGYFNLSEAGTLRVGVFNIFDEEYARWANIQGLTATSTTSIENAQQPGTNFRVGFSYEF